jgi:universal stress protein E
MQQLHSILVVISAKRVEHPALQRALKFAETRKIHIHLFNSIYEPVMELTDVLSSDHRKEMKRQYLADRQLYLDSLAQDLTHPNITCSTHLSWHRELHEAIEQAVEEIKPDLVIKHISADADSHNPFTMPVDRHLLRYCKAPLLLVNEPQWTPGPILAAVDPTATDDAHKALNQEIIFAANTLAALTSTNVHIINSYETPTLSPSLDLVNFDAAQMHKNAAQWHAKQMHSLVAQQGFSKDHIHVVEGAPETVIPQVAEQIQAQVVVLGTVGRTGLAAAFIGNTAERVLSKLKVEVLVLKPNCG